MSDESSNSEESFLVNGGSKKRKSGIAAVDYTSLKLTRRDKYLLAVSMLNCVGCAISLYLPGVFTQEVSREIGISKRQEGLLGVILYISMTVVSLSLPPALKRFKRRSVILFSLYSVVIGSIFAAAVPNYWTLLLSRIITGASVGLNYVIMSVYFAEEISSYSNYNAANFVNLLLFAFGAGLSAILGYLLLDKLGWRALLIAATVPFFTPPIFIIHIFLKEIEAVASPGTDYGSVANEPPVGIKEPEEIEVDNFVARVVKVSVANGINFLQGWGSILLTPALLKYQNQAAGDEIGDVTNTQLLILALLFGGVKLIGRILGYFLLRYIPFRILQPIVSLVIAGCYLAVLLQSDSMLATVIGIGIANMAFCVSRIELTLLETDKFFFGTERLALAASVTMGFGYLGACLGAVCAAFLSVHNAVLVTFSLSCVQIVIFLSINER